MFTVTNLIEAFGTPQFGILLLPPLFIVALGLVFGSFFNVLIYRLPREESIVKPGSHCPACNHKLRPWENIPLVSYAFLGGKCSSCKKAISLQYPLIECSTAVCAVVLWYSLVVPHSAIAGALITASVQALVLLFMIPVFIIDLKHSIISDTLTFPGIALALAVSFIPGGITPLQSIIGAAAGGGTLWALGMIGTLIFKKGDAMGGGDVCFMLAVGALWGWQIALGTIGIASLLGSVVGVGLILFHSLSDDHRMPFGPFLIAGVIISLYALEPLLTLYINWVRHVIRPA